MRNLLRFLYQNRIFGFFLLLESISVWLIINNHRFYNAHYINSSNQISGNLIDFTDNSKDYFALNQINQELAQENAFLRQQSLQWNDDHQIQIRDGQFSIITAEVINNSYRKSANYLTIRAGSDQGIKPQMGIISAKGVVGKVKSVSTNYSTVTSLLHQNLLVSSQLKRLGTLCTVQWDGISPIESELKYIPRHIKINIGDSVVTSGFNAVFPKGLFIGKVISTDLPDESAYYNAKVRLAEDFTSLNYVYVIMNQLKTEKDSLESTIN